MWQQKASIDQEANNQVEFRQCFKCNYEAVAPPGPCPQCRHAKFFTAKNIRNRGIFLILVGLFLVVFMGSIAVFVGMLLLGSMKDPTTAKRLHQESFTLLAVYAVFAAVIAFGINSIVGGIWMIAFGKRNRFFVWIMWATLFLIFACGAAFQLLA